MIPGVEVGHEYEYVSAGALEWLWYLIAYKTPPNFWREYQRKKFPGSDLRMWCYRNAHLKCDKKTWTKHGTRTAGKIVSVIMLLECTQENKSSIGIAENFL